MDRDGAESRTALGSVVGAPKAREVDFGSTTVGPSSTGLAALAAASTAGRVTEAKGTTASTPAFASLAVAGAPVSRGPAVRLRGHASGRGSRCAGEGLATTSAMRGPRNTTATGPSSPSKGTEKASRTPS